MAQGPIVTPGGGMLPGDLRSLGIGTLPQIDPAVAGAMAAPPPVVPDPTIPVPADVAGTPPGVPQAAPEVPVGAGAPHIGLPASLTEFLATGKLPPPPPQAVTPPPSPFEPAPPTPPPAPMRPKAAPKGKAPARPAVIPDVPTPTLGQASAFTQSAFADQIRAAVGLGDVLARQADAVAVARRETDADINAQMERLKQTQEKRDQIWQEKSQAIQAAQANEDAYKLDPNRFYKGMGTAKKVGFWISAAIAGLGEALQYKSGPNPVLQQLDAELQKDVRVQMDEREQLRRKTGRLVEERDSLDRFSQSKLAQEQYMLGLAYNYAAHQIETVGAQYGSETARARTKEAVAGYQTKAAEAFQKAAEIAADHEFKKQNLAENIAMRKAQIGLGYSQLGETSRHNREMEDIERNKRQFEMALAQAKSQGERDKLAMEREKDIRENAVNDPVKSAPVLRPEGRQMYAEAAKLEALASEAETPEDRAKLLGTAKALRKEAEFRFPVLVTSDRARELNKAMSATQSALTTIDKINQIREKKGPKWFTTTEGVQELQSLASTLDMFLKGTFQMGALDRGALLAAMNMRGGDPSKVSVGDISESIGAKGTEAGLLALAKSLELMGYNELGSTGQLGDNWQLDKHAFKFRRADVAKKTMVDEHVGALKGKSLAEFDAGTSEEARALLKGKSPQEQAEIIEKAKGEGPSTGTVLGVPFVGSSTGEQLAGRPDASGKYPGLTGAQEVALDRLLETANRDVTQIADPEARQEARAESQKAREQIIATMKEAWPHAGRKVKGRPEYLDALRSALQQSDPALYEEVLSRIPSTFELVRLAESGDKAADAVIRKMPKEKLPDIAKTYLADAARKSASKLPAVQIGPSFDQLRAEAAGGNEKAYAQVVQAAVRQNPALSEMVERARKDPALAQALREALLADAPTLADLEARETAAEPEPAVPMSLGGQ